MAEIKEAPKSFSDRARDAAKLLFRNENATLGMVLVAVIFIMGYITKGLSLALMNMKNVLMQSSVRGLGAIGEAFVILNAGIDVSIGGVGLFCAVLGAAVMTDSQYNIIGTPLPLALGLLIMLMAGVGWGAINGSSVSRIGMPALIVTLAMWEISTGASFVVTKGISIPRLPKGLAFFASDVAGVPVPAIIFAVAAVVGYFVLNHTTFGREMYAVGGNPVSSWLSGIKVKNVTFSAYVISGFLAGLAAIITTARLMSASMKSMMGLELDAIASVVVGGISLTGGRGNLIGVIIGVLIIGVVNNGMSILGASPDLQRIVKGVIIFTAVAVDFLRRRR